MFSRGKDGLSAGDTIPFGGYDWRVLDADDNKALIITEEIIEKRIYHKGNTVWGDSDLRAYLNEEFYNKFSEKDRGKIISVVNKNLDNTWNERYGTIGKGGDDTVDSIFLIRLDEVIRYFGDSGDFENRNAWNFKGTSVKNYVPSKDGSIIRDEYNENRIAKYQGKPCFWWLRTPGPGGNHSLVVVSDDGSIFIHGYSNSGSPQGIRPALWLNLEQSRGFAYEFQGNY
jgi:hypothetical protein